MLHGARGPRGLCRAGPGGPWAAPRARCRAVGVQAPQLLRSGPQWAASLGVASAGVGAGLAPHRHPHVQRARPPRRVFRVQSVLLEAGSLTALTVEDPQTAPSALCTPADVRGPRPASRGLAVVLPAVALAARVPSAFACASL